MLDKVGAKVRPQVVTDGVSYIEEAVAPPDSSVFENLCCLTGLGEPSTKKLSDAASGVSGFVLVDYDGGRCLGGNGKRIEHRLGEVLLR